MPIRIFATEATRADCAEAQELIAGIPAQHLIADKGYDSDAIVQKAQSQGMQPVIPPRKNRKEQRAYDKHLYRQRHLSSFLAAVQIRCLALWLISCDDTVQENPLKRHSFQQPVGLESRHVETGGADLDG